VFSLKKIRYGGKKNIEKINFFSLFGVEKKRRKKDDRKLDGKFKNIMEKIFLTKM